MTFRPQTRPWAALVVAAVAAVYVSGAAAQWAWKEDNGRVVYSDRPPPPSIKSSQIIRQPSIAAPASAPQTTTPALAGEAARPGESAGAPTSPSVPNAPNAPKTVAERDMEFRKRQQERADNERKAQEEQQKAASKAAECERARGYLRSLEDGLRVTRTDASGNREFLDDAGRASEIDRTRKMVQSLCN